MAYAQDRVSVWVEAIHGQPIETQFAGLSEPRKTGSYASRASRISTVMVEEDLALPTEYVPGFCSEKELLNANRRRQAEKLGIISEEEKELEGPSLNFKRNKADAILTTMDPGEKIFVKVFFQIVNQEFDIPVSKIFQENTDNVISGANDLTALTFLEEANVLSALKFRYTREMIYTSIAGVVVAINPCKRIPVYTKEMMMSYRSYTSISQVGAHIYKAAEDAYRGLTAQYNHNFKKMPTNQSMIVCGESGSGKTESAKHMMRYLANRSNDLDKPETSDGKDAAIEQQIVETNFILEAIGNAKTKLNHNSSRFGKFTKMYFKTGNLDPMYDVQKALPSDNRVVGASTETYLLEKSRIVLQSKGERNFHVFYGLVGAARIQRGFRCQSLVLLLWAFQEWRLKTLTTWLLLQISIMKIAKMQTVSQQLKDS